MTVADSLRGIRGKSSAGDPARASSLDVQVADAPSFQAPFDLFKGEWRSYVPGYGGGGAELFDDARVKWFAEQCGGFRGKRVLELGPLEGAHTSMIAAAGARVTAIEASGRAFLKCLIVKNALKFDADFQLGDFRPYLERCEESFDLVLASGVLDHVAEPVELLNGCARVSPSIALRTHYYDHEAVAASDGLRRHFTGTLRLREFRGRELSAWEHVAPHGFWLTRDSLLWALDALGFNIVIGEDNPAHPNGPAMTLVATRR